MSHVVVSKPAASPSTGPSDSSHPPPAPSLPQAYEFICVHDHNGNLKPALSVAYKKEWASYWTVDYRLAVASDRKSSCFQMVAGCLALPAALLATVFVAVFTAAFYAAAAVPMLLLGALVAMWASCTFKRTNPVATLEEFYYWLERNDFTKEELDAVKKATKKMCLHQLLVQLTDVRDVEILFQLKSIEKQKAVLFVLTQSKAVIEKDHLKEYTKLRNKYAGELFTWAAMSAYQLGDFVARNGPKNPRKQKDWEARVAGKVDLRVNAVLRCINTIAKEATYKGSDPRLADLQYTMDRTQDPVDWKEFALKNVHHDNKLWAEFHTAAPFVKQYVTQTILDETACNRFMRFMRVWVKKLLAVTVVLVKVILTMDFASLGDIVDTLTDAVTELAEDPVGFLEIVIDGQLNGDQAPATAASGDSGGFTDMAMGELNDNYGRQARLEGRIDDLCAGGPAFVNVTETPLPPPAPAAQPEQTRVAP